MIEDYDFEYNPGSKEARDKGCKCPIIDNNCGRGGYKGWVINTACPIHKHKV